MVAVTYGSARVAALAKTQPKRKGFFVRFMDALIEARMRQAYREIALHQHLLKGVKLEPGARNERSAGR